jgi:hypothetical protein
MVIAADLSAYAQPPVETPSGAAFRELEASDYDYTREASPEWNKPKGRLGPASHGWREAFSPEGYCPHPSNHSPDISILLKAI